MGIQSTFAYPASTDWRSQSIALGAVTFNDLVAGGDATFDLIPSPTVDAAACGGASDVFLVVRYFRAPPSDDLDGDGVPDECACPADVTGDGVVDVLDLLQIILGWGACPV